MRSTFDSIKLPTTFVGQFRMLSIVFCFILAFLPAGYYGRPGLSRDICNKIRTLPFATDEKSNANDEELEILELCDGFEEDNKLADEEEQSNLRAAQPPLLGGMGNVTDFFNRLFGGDPTKLVNALTGGPPMLILRGSSTVLMPLGGAAGLTAGLQEFLGGLKPKKS